MKRVIREHGSFLFFYGALFLFFLWPLLLLKESFLFGDYRVQIYPWIEYFAKELREGRLSYWTDAIACGFPLAAEGQIGAYYLPHLLAFSIFPIKAAYTWSVPLHMLLGGVGFYVYAKRCGQSPAAAAFSSMIFSFSTAYGGCFYTLGTLRTLAWLPWCLYLIESADVLPRRPWLWVSLFAGAIALMWTAGFAQVALYALVYLFLYLLFRPAGKIRLLVFFAAANAIAVILALPQLWATFELITESARAGQGAGFATWGSVWPPAVVSLLFPEWGRLVLVSFYIGITPLFLSMLALFSKKSSIEKRHAWLALVFLVLAFGGYVPCYGWVLEKLSLTLLRNPSKFLFFVAVSLAMLAGFGFDKLAGSRHRKRFMAIAGTMTVLVVAVWWIAPFAFRATKPQLERFAHQKAAAYYEAKADPQRGPEHYHTAMSAVLARADDMLTHDQANQLKTLVFTVISALLVFSCLIAGPRRKKWLLMLVPFVAAADLYLGGHSAAGGLFDGALGTGFIGNSRPWSWLETRDPRVPKRLAEKVRGLQKDGHFTAVEAAEDPLLEVFPPNENMRFGIRHAGGYSPLLLKRYYELSKEFGWADASLGRRPYSEDVWRKGRGIIDALGIREIISEKEMDIPGLRLLEKSEGRNIYINDGALPLLYLSYGWKELENKKERLDYLKSPEFSARQESVVEDVPNFAEGAGHPGIAAAEWVKADVYGAEAVVHAAGPALAVFRNAFYPRWKARIDGEAAPLVPVNHALSGVWLRTGTHKIIFYYDKEPHRFAEGTAFAAWLVLFLVIAGNRKKEAHFVWIYIVLIGYLLFYFFPKVRGL